MLQGELFGYNVGVPDTEIFPEFGRKYIPQAEEVGYLATNQNHR